MTVLSVPGPARSRYRTRDSFEHEGAAFELDLSGCSGVETTISGWDAARLQRAAQRAGQSASRRSDHARPAGSLHMDP